MCTHLATFTFDHGLVVDTKLTHPVLRSETHGASAYTSRGRLPTGLTDVQRKAILNTIRCGWSVLEPGKFRRECNGVISGRDLKVRILVTSLTVELG